MRSLNLLLVAVQCLLVMADESTPWHDDGYLQNCKQDLYDVVLSLKSTDSMRLQLVDGDMDKYHSYNISRAEGLIKDPLLKQNQPTVILMHGFNEIKAMKSLFIPVYLIKGGYNVIMIDGVKLLRGDYIKSVRLTMYMGRRLGMLLEQLVKRGFKTDKLQLVGHSLGAHMMGHAAKTFKKLTGKKLPFVTGLDPAGPCYRNASANRRIDSSDADFVQIIHTNAGFMGLKTQLGHADFYVNGGTRQVADESLICRNLCSHGYVNDYWLASLKSPDGFVGVECATFEEIDAGWCRGKDRKTAVMGAFADRKARGLFYVKTFGKPPYGMGMKGVYDVNPLLKKP